MALADAFRENRDTILRGVVLLVGGLALILAATMVGYGDSKLAMILAGTLGIGGVCAMFLGFFIYLLPPILPGK